MLTTTVPATDRLRSIPLFSGVPDRDLRAIDRLMTEIAFPPHRILIEESRLGQEFFVLTSGHVDVSRCGHQIASLGPGDFFGEMALLDRRPRSATVSTATTITAFVLGTREFSSLMHGHPLVARNMLRLMSERLRPAA